MDVKGTLKKIGKCVGIGVLGAILNHMTGDNDNGSLKTDIKTAILVGIGGALKTEGKKDE